MRKFLKFFNIFAIFWQILPFYMYNIKQMEDERMRKSKLIAVFTAATMAMTMAAPSALPGDGFGVITKADEKKETVEVITEGRCGDNANYHYNPETKTITISGTGDMWDDTGFAKTMRNAENIVVEKGIVSIGNSSFDVLDEVKKVEIADTVTTIKSHAFGYIRGTFTIPESVIRVESEAIGGADKIVVKGNMDYYGYAAFGEGADEIEIGQTANQLGYALAGVYEYKDFSVTISKTNTQCRISNGCIMSLDGKTVYYYVSDKKNVIIPDSVQTICPAAFYQKNIQTVTLGKNVKTIGEYAFADSYLSKVTTNRNLKIVGRYAFAGTNLKEVTLKSKVTMYPRAFESKVKIYYTKSFKNAKTVVTNAKFSKKKINIRFCKIAGAKGYQIQIKRGKKKYRYTTRKNSVGIKTPKALKNTYNIRYNYDIGEYTGETDGNPAYVTVRPYKILKGRKKSYGKWSNKIILSK